MNLIAIWQFAVTLGQEAMWPAFTLALLVYSLNYTLKFRRENQKLKKERTADRLNAVSRANRLISELKQDAFSADELVRIKSGIMQVAEIDVSSSIGVPTPKTELQADDVDIYNKSNTQALTVAFLVSLPYTPLIVIGYMITGWNSTWHLSGVDFVKHFSKSTTVSTGVNFASTLPVFVALFLVLKTFCARSSIQTQVPLCVGMLVAAVVAMIIGSAPSEVYLP